jgi:formate hydrogenlyase subunit 4
MKLPAHTIETAAQAALLVVLGPLVTGFIQKTKARLQCRQGASMWQPYRDLAKLLRKGTVQSDTASPFFRAIPVLVLVASLSTTAMLPVLWVGPELPALGDAILLLALLALARFLLAIGALDAGGAFGGMGASREMTVGLLVEPALMMAVFSVAVAGGLDRPSRSRAPAPDLARADLAGS